MKFHGLSGIVGTSLSRIGGTDVRGRRRPRTPWGFPQHVRTSVRVHRTGVAVLGMAEAGAEVVNAALRPMIADLPSTKQFWVPLCPQERAP